MHLQLLWLQGGWVERLRDVWPRVHTLLSMSPNLCASIIYHSLAMIPIVMYPVDAAIVSVVMRASTGLKGKCDWDWFAKITRYFPTGRDHLWKKQLWFENDRQNKAGYIDFIPPTKLENWALSCTILPEYGNDNRYVVNPCIALCECT